MALRQPSNVTGLILGWKGLLCPSLGLHDSVAGICAQAKTIRCKVAAASRPFNCIALDDARVRQSFGLTARLRCRQTN